MVRDTRNTAKTELMCDCLLYTSLVFCPYFYAFDLPILYAATSDR